MNNWHLGLLMCLFSSSIAFADPVDSETGRDIFFQTLQSLPREQRRCQNLRRECVEPTSKKFHLRKIQKETDKRTNDPICHGWKKRHRHDALGISADLTRNSGSCAIYQKRIDEFITTDKNGWTPMAAPDKYLTR